MDVESLKSFIVLAESRSVSQAAKKLFIAQSALSNRLKALEKECKTTLIERDYHNFRLTQSGMKLYEKAQKIVELAESALSEVRTADNGLSGSLNIAATPSLATGILRDFVKRFNDKYPFVTVRVFEGATPSVLANLDDGLCDLALVRTPYTTGESYVSKTLGSDGMVILGAEPLPETLTLNDLFSYKLVLTHRYTALLSRIAESRGRSLNAPVQCEEIATCIAMTETGVGVTMIPQSTYLNHAEHGMKLFKADLIDHDCDTSCELVYLMNKTLSAAAKNFEETVFSDAEC